MTEKDVYLSTLGLSESITKAYLSELSAADLLVRPVPGMNHIAWQLGHLILTERNFVEMMKPGYSPALPENFEAGHGRRQTTDDSPADYCEPAEYIRLMDAQRDATKKALADMTDAELDAPGPEGVRQMAPTNGGLFLLIGNHYLMHAGQYVAVRRKLEKPVTI